MREIIDGGPHLADLTEKHLAGIYRQAGATVARNMEAGASARAIPSHVMASVGGVTLFYFLIVPVLRLIWDRDPLDPDVVAERARMARDLLLHGLAGPATPKETTP